LIESIFTNSNSKFIKNHHDQLGKVGRTLFEEVCFIENQRNNVKTQENLRTDYGWWTNCIKSLEWLNAVYENNLFGTANTDMFHSWYLGSNKKAVSAVVLLKKSLELREKTWELFLVVLLLKCSLIKHFIIGL